MNFICGFFPPGVKYLRPEKEAEDEDEHTYSDAGIRTPNTVEYPGSFCLACLAIAVFSRIKFRNPRFLLFWLAKTRSNLEHRIIPKENIGSEKGTELAIPLGRGESNPGLRYAWSGQACPLCAVHYVRLSGSINSGSRKQEPDKKIFTSYLSYLFGRGESNPGLRDASEVASSMIKHARENARRWCGNLAKSLKGSSLSIRTRGVEPRTTGWNLDPLGNWTEWNYVPPSRLNREFEVETLKTVETEGKLVRWGLNGAFWCSIPPQKKDEYQTKGAFTRMPRFQEDENWDWPHP
ncbi:hypothetical protein C8R47DRAFT_1067608 [Mycena vitilis]|nr:hypothetical protein C8R47DRAFT_1067608 [Mycena vitilis]